MLIHLAFDPSDSDEFCDWCHFNRISEKSRDAYTCYLPSLIQLCKFIKNKYTIYCTHLGVQLVIHNEI
jgi:hypothetical protein